MTALSTPITLPPAPPSLSFGDLILSLGSCFSEHIPSYLQAGGMEALINPFGTQYNPLSIARTLSRILEGKPFESEELIQHGGLYHSLLHHGAFSRVTSGETLEAINASLCSAHTQLPRLRYLLLTWGTSYVYHLRETGEVVSNCHKLPEKLFIRERVDVPSLLHIWTPLLRKLLELQPGLQLILTVSPVRHLRDGAHANTLSKATLHLFTEELQRLFPDHVHYFPAYELVLDELRDYRFYAEDMAHPSTLTQRLVAERFAGLGMSLPCEPSPRHSASPWSFATAHYMPRPRCIRRGWSVSRHGSGTSSVAIPWPSSPYPSHTASPQATQRGRQDPLPPNDLSPHTARSERLYGG